MGCEMFSLGKVFMCLLILKWKKKNFSWSRTHLVVALAVGIMFGQQRAPQPDLQSGLHAHRGQKRGGLRASHSEIYTRSTGTAHGTHSGRIRTGPGVGTSPNPLWNSSVWLFPDLFFSDILKSFRHAGIARQCLLHSMDLSSQCFSRNKQQGRLNFTLWPLNVALSSDGAHMCTASPCCPG